MIDTSISIDLLNKTGKDNLQAHLNIEYVEVTKNFLKARMPVDYRTHQQLGMMHGGASASLAEMTGSMAAYLSIDRENFFCVGQELKINHLKAVKDGYVYALAEPLHIGKQSHVWQIKTTHEGNEQELVAFSTLTMAVIPLDKNTRQIIGDIFKKYEHGLK